MGITIGQPYPRLLAGVLKAPPLVGVFWGFESSAPSKVCWCFRGFAPSKVCWCFESSAEWVSFLVLERGRSLFVGFAGFRKLCS